MSNVTTWPMPLTEKPFPLYALSVNGIDVPVWPARVREELYMPEGAGYTHSFNGRCDWAGFARFDFADRAEVTVTVARDFTSADVRPATLGIPVHVEGRTVSFTMSEPRPVTVLLDGRDEQPLHLFTHRPETDPPSPDDPDVIYFGPGEHWVDTIQLRDGQTLYLDGGALVRAVLPAGIKGKQGGVQNLVSYPPPVVDIRDATNVRVCGRGILDGTALPHPARNLIRVTNSRTVTIEGITLRNAPNWHLPIFGSSDVVVQGLSGISGRLNTDGINCVSSQDVRVSDCFIRGHDDTFVVKTMDPDRPSQHIHYDRCVAWNDWGYALGVSYETRADIHDIRFTNCDVIFARNWALGVHAADDGTVEDIRFKHVTVEYPATSIDPMMSRALLRIDNEKDIWAKSEGVGHVRDITLDGVTVQGRDIPPILIHGTDAAHPIEAVRLRGVTVNGSTITDTDSAMFKFNDHVNDVRAAAHDARL